MIALLIALMTQAELETVGKACQKTSELKSYAVHISIGIEGGGENAVDLVFEGGYTEGEGTCVKGSYLETPMGLYRRDGKTAVIDAKDKSWKNADDIKPEKGKRTPGKNFQVPHEEIKGFEKKLKDVRKVEAEKGCDVYTAELTEEGARSLLPPNARVPQIKASGDVKIWINADGFVSEIMIIHITEGSVQGKDFRITTTRTNRLSKLNEYKVDVPEDARKALSR